MNDQLFRSLFDEQERRPMTVSELNADVCRVLERSFASVWVEGEVVNFIQASSGHWYFNLNDGSSQIRCVCFKGTNYRIRFKPQNGLTVRVRGRLTLYEPRGEFQLAVDSLEPSGEGALAIAFEQIRRKLETEGLFDVALKRPLPFFPKRIGVVTSRSGAAYHDILNVLTRRAQSISILLIPTLVQGESAADQIRKAVADANLYNTKLAARDRIEVLIISRGGGSAEDLWAFNDEMLARAIRASLIPVISAVGHEIDVTIADLVADVRAATPSAAAEIVAGREADILNTLEAREQELFRILEYKTLELDSTLQAKAGQLQSTVTEKIYRRRSMFANTSSRLSPAQLSAKIGACRSLLEMTVQRQSQAGERLIKSREDVMNTLMAKLDVLSPLAVLNRGFSITQSEQGAILRDAAMTKPGDKLKIRLANGKLKAEVLQAEPGN